MAGISCWLPPRPTFHLDLVEGMHSMRAQALAMPSPLVQFGLFVIMGSEVDHVKVSV